MAVYKTIYKAIRKEIRKAIYKATLKPVSRKLLTISAVAITARCNWIKLAHLIARWWCRGGMRKLA